MKQFLMTVAGVFVGLVLFLVGVPFLLIVMAASAARPAPIPTHTVLQLDLRGGLPDQESQNPFAALGGGGGQSVMSIIETLRRAETDDKVEAVLVRLPEGGMAPASADELRLAFKHFRAVGKKPIFGICLGHQILGLAFGGRTYKLKFGHHGGNQPVMDLTTRKVEITAQNHGFAVDADSLKGAAEVTHLNLNDNTVEGLAHRELPIFSVQYHPESSPGPHDANYLFKRFTDMMAKHRRS